MHTVAAAGVVLNLNFKFGKLLRRLSRAAAGALSHKFRVVNNFNHPGPLKKSIMMET